VAGLGRPCEGVGGDYYDVIVRGDGMSALVVGDVSDHGIGPALYMASARALIHALMKTGTSPVRTLLTLNDFLCRDMGPCDFMTVFLGVLDPATRGLAYASAGHNPPLCLRRDGTLETLDKTGPLLGMLEGATYGSEQIAPLEPGDALLLYTDGIYEAKDAFHALYGEDRLRASFECHVRAGRDARGIRDGLLEDLDIFCGSCALEDDVTCLVIRARPDRPPVVGPRGACGPPRVSS
ncbi:MAG: PP2C family protein-serine/threonine phosphatase, partial [Planctomycetota bacterium]